MYCRLVGFDLSMGRWGSCGGVLSLILAQGSSLLPLWDGGSVLVLSALCGKGGILLSEPLTASVKRYTVPYTVHIYMCVSLGIL